MVLTTMNGCELDKRLRYLEARLGILGADHPLFWKTYPEIPSWLNDYTIWETAKRNTLIREGDILLAAADQELDIADRTAHEDRVKRIADALAALQPEPEDVKTAPTNGEKVVVVSRRPNLTDGQDFKVSQRNVPEEDDYAGLSEVVQNVWLKASNWTSLLKSDGKKIDTVSMAQGKNVDETEVALRQALRNSRNESISWIKLLLQLISALFYAFLVLVLIVLGR